MKRTIILIMLATIFNFIYSQEIILPPELKWWIIEVQKANPEVTIQKFKSDTTQEFKIENSKINTNKLYPVFMRWNFSANKLAYLNTGADLTKEKNGKYSMSFDIDSAVYILNDKNQILFQDWYGSSSGINALAWLNDNKLVGVGIEIESINSEKSIVNLIIKFFDVKNDKILVTVYQYKKAFNSDVRSSLKLNWYEQRDDYFVIKK